MRFLTAATAALVLAAGAAMTAQATAPDFSGTWTLDKDRSHSFPVGLEQTMTIVQAGDEVKVNARLKTAQGEQQVAETYTLDGVQRTYEPPQKGARGLRTASWMPGRRGILVADEITTETPKGPSTTSVTRKVVLSSDRQTLTIDYYMDTPRGSGESKRVFFRQK
jgi:hypothetical protein